MLGFDRMYTMREDSRTTHLANIISLTNKGSRNKINIIGDTPVDDIINIFFRQGGQVDNHTRQVHVLAFSDRSIVFDAAGDFTNGNIRRQDGQDEATISHQDLLSGTDRFGQRRVRACQLFVAALEGIVRSQNDGFALDQVNLLSFSKESRTNLRLKCILKHCERDPFM